MLRFRKKYPISLPPEVNESLIKLAKDAKTSKSKYVERLINQAEQNKNWRK